MNRDNYDEKDVKRVQNLIVEVVRQSPESYDDIDLKRVSTDGKYVMRFINEKDGKIDEAFKMLNDTLKWRKENGINQLNAHDFPREFFRAAEIEIFRPDKNGIPTVYVRVSRHRVANLWKEDIKRFLLYLIESIDQAAIKAGNRFGLIFDARDGSIFNVELDLDYFGLKTILNYYPGTMQYIAIYKLPFILKAIFSIIRSWFPKQYKDLFIFVGDEKSLDDLIGLENAPEYVGGKSPIVYPEYCETCPTLEDFCAVKNYSQAHIDQVLDKYRFAFDEYEAWKNNNEIKK